MSSRLWPKAFFMFFAVDRKLSLSAYTDPNTNLCVALIAATYNTRAASLRASTSASDSACTPSPGAVASAPMCSSRSTPGIATTGNSSPLLTFMVMTFTLLASGS